MAIIVPTITAENAHVYREQIERVEPFAERIHVDLMDGVFTPNKSVGIDALWWPEATEVDIHLMFREPESVLDQLIELQPSLVIIPAESQCNFADVAQKLRAANIRVGLSLLLETPVASVEGVLSSFDHLLVFSGNLGYQGGSHANLALLDKVQQAKSIKSDLEIGWDGGVNDTNVRQLVEAGVSVINSGGFIHHSESPEVAYRHLADSI